MNVKRILIIDAIVLVAYFIAANPAITGLGVHEWVSLGIVVLFIIHVAQHYDWVIEAFKSARKNPSPAQTGRLALDILLVITFMACTISGIMVSRFILPLFGFVAPGYFFWNPIHSMSAKVLLALLVIHIVVNVGRIGSYLKTREKPRQEEPVAKLQDERLQGASNED